jgi:hypothetical protein
MKLSLAMMSLIFLSGSVAFASWNPLDLFKKKSSTEVACESAREFIVTLEYLRNKTDLAGSGDNAIQIAKKVSRGCTGSALRFINTANLLTKAELDNRSVIETSIEMAQRDEATASAFFDIFQRTFQSSALDLDLYASLRVAKRLTTEFSGDTAYVANDYSKIVEFCLNSEGMALSKPKCAGIGAQFSAYGEKHKAAVFDQFQGLYKFLSANSDQQLTLDAKLDVMAKVLSVNSLASTNFMKSYEYAMSEKGLNGVHKDALELALTLSGYSEPIKKEE